MGGLVGRESIGVLSEEEERRRPEAGAAVVGPYGTKTPLMPVTPAEYGTDMSTGRRRGRP
jgi:hypothetical protein